MIIDINDEKAHGEAMDIRQGVPFCSPVNIYAGTYEDAEGSDIVVLTSGMPRKAGQSRLELSQVNVDITKQIIPQIVKHAPNAVYIIVSNPIDVLTYLFHKISGLPANQIIGSGTTLDTARLRTGLSETFNISQQNVHAYVFGEHGDSSFVPWSLANISNIPIKQYMECLPADKRPELNYAEIEDYMRKSGSRIIASKGATFYAISMSVCHICKCLFSGIDTTLTVSTMMNGEYGINDVCLSTLSVVNRNGVEGKLAVPLTDEEVAKLHKSADNLKNVISQIKL